VRHREHRFHRCRCWSWCGIHGGPHTPCRPSGSDLELPVDRHPIGWFERNPLRPTRTSRLFNSVNNDTGPRPTATGIARRRVLIGSGAAGAAAAVAVVGATPVAAATTVTVWRLDPDWGYPRGPHGKTRLRSRASRNAAAHRYARTEADALAMNLHRCSFAPAVPVEVDGAAFAELWNSLAAPWTNPWNGEVVEILDDRHVGRIPTGPQLHAAAFGTGGSMIDGPGGGGADAGAAQGSPSSTAALALTGSSTSTAVAIGFGAISSGVAALHLRRRAVQRATSASS